MAGASLPGPGSSTSTAGRWPGLTRQGTAASLLNLGFTDTEVVWGGNVMGGQGWRGALPAPTLCQYDGPRAAVSLSTRCLPPGPCCWAARSRGPSRPPPSEAATAPARPGGRLGPPAGGAGRAGAAGPRLPTYRDQALEGQLCGGSGCGQVGEDCGCSLSNFVSVRTMKL